MKLNIKGLDKAELLAALFNASKAQGLSFLDTGHNKKMTPEEAAVELQLRSTTYIGYLNGRVMKVDVGGDEMETWAYDRDNGEGAAERVVKALRAQEKVAFTISSPSSKLELAAARGDTKTAFFLADQETHIVSKASESAPSEMKAT